MSSPLILLLFQSKMHSLVSGLAIINWEQFLEKKIFPMIFFWNRSAMVSMTVETWVTSQRDAHVWASSPVSSSSSSLSWSSSSSTLLSSSTSSMSSTLSISSTNSPLSNFDAVIDAHLTNWVLHLCCLGLQLLKSWPAFLKYLFPKRVRANILTISSRP